MRSNPHQTLCVERKSRTLTAETLLQVSLVDIPSSEQIHMTCEP